MSLPRPFPPPWASAWGEDADAGLWAAFRLGDQEQRCRWIVPGTFLMGSPPDEAERDGDETQHTVTLSRGYWLADTACTQGLWQAVMGANPSHFQGDPARPVETVSWDDVQDFLGRLNARVPGLAAGLPTEAQWEYACRAETTGPFSFGDPISPEQVNYNGNYPYAGGKTGRYREETVPVSSLPANPWGLYQMHGNVWEWCADWYGAYGAGPQVDPVGPAEGSGRVVRGGSWLDRGCDCRSAARIWFAPDERYGSVGFRLAPGQGGEGAAGAGAGRAEPAAGQAPATPSRVRKTSPSRPKARKGRT